MLTNLEPQDLLQYGLIPEFIGRLPIVATLRDLDKKALIEILTEPKNALIKQYQKMFQLDEVKLTFTEDALIAIADKAILRETGARGLRSILENILIDTMYSLPDMENVEEVIINSDVVQIDAKPLIMYSKVSRNLKSTAS